jgi:hypothetical protein
MEAPTGSFADLAPGAELEYLEKAKQARTSGALTEMSQDKGRIEE